MLVAVVALDLLKIQGRSENCVTKCLEHHKHASPFQLLAQHPTHCAR